MTGKIKLIHSHQDIDKPCFLHPSITQALFEHRRFVKNIFLQIKGHYEIAYFGINIINPAHELVTFSSMPHIEFNLIHHGLWMHDNCFTPQGLNKNTLLFWDENNINSPFSDQISDLKLACNHFTNGATLLREVEGFNFLYSIATQSIKKDLKNYYNSNIFGLIDIGDYFCQSVLRLYAEYCGRYPLPKLAELTSKASDVSVKSTLKLIVNNE